MIARYSTARWQRLRKAVLAHHGYVCQIQGPRCCGVANTVHHILPSSQYSELFWNPENLEAVQIEGADRELVLRAARTLRPIPAGAR